MTVKELKEKLNQFDDNLIVCIDGDIDITDRTRCPVTVATNVSQGFNELDGCLIIDDYVEDDCVSEKDFIASLKTDLSKLTDECYQKHSPEYYDEHQYYNLFHKYIPNNLLLTSSYIKFVEAYNTNNKNLYEAVRAFLDDYEGNNND